MPPKLAFDFDSADSRYSIQPVDNLTAEKVFERQWVFQNPNRKVLCPGKEIRILPSVARTAEPHRRRELWLAVSPAATIETIVATLYNPFSAGWRLLLSKLRSCQRTNKTLVRADWLARTELKRIELRKPFTARSKNGQ